MSLNRNSHTSKFLGVILGTAGLLSVYYIPIMELQIQGSFLIIDVDINNSFTMYELLQTLDNYDFSTEILKMSVGLITVGSVILGLTVADIRLMILGSVVNAIGVGLFIYNYAIDTDSSFEGVDLVSIEPQAGIVLLTIVPVVSLVFGIIEYKFPNKIPI